MGKQLELREVRHGVQLVLIERDSGWRIRRRRTFTVPRHDFDEACRAAGLVVEVALDPTTTEAKEMRLANEIAWYTAILALTGGTPDVKIQVEALWTRITRGLGLR